MKKSVGLLEKTRTTFKRLKLLFSIISILAMLSYPIIQIYLDKGNRYVNIGVLIVSLIYGIFWLILGSNKAYKINRIYKYSKLFLNLISLLINAYAIYITATNFNLISVVVSIIMGISFICNLIFNIMYDIITRKISLMIKETKDDINNYRAKLASKKKKQLN